MWITTRSSRPAFASMFDLFSGSLGAWILRPVDDPGEYPRRSAKTTHSRRRLDRATVKPSGSQTLRQDVEATQDRAICAVAGPLTMSRTGWWHIAAVDRNQHTAVVITDTVKIASRIATVVPLGTLFESVGVVGGVAYHRSCDSMASVAGSIGKVAGETAGIGICSPHVDLD